MFFVFLSDTTLERILIDPLDLIGLESVSYFKPILNISHFVIQCSFY